MKTVFEAALELLQQGERSVLTVILNNEGSTPRDEGAKMLVRTDGSIFGTIGGGPMEYAVMRRSAEVLKTGRGEVMPFDLGGKDVQRSVSICGGKALVCLYPMDERDIPILEKVCSPEGRQKLLALQILRNVESGAIRLSCTDEKEPTADEVLYRELPEIKNTLYLIGGGHVCEATAKVAVVAGFDIVVVDDREEFANNVRFPGAKCVVCQEYDEIPTDTVSEHDYILDTFILQLPDNLPPEEYPDRQSALEAELNSFIHGNTTVQKQSGRPHISRRIRHIPIPPTVIITPEEDYPGWHTIDITAVNRPHLLADIAETFFAHNISLRYAKITTLDQRIEDSFITYSPSLQDPQTQNTLKQALIEVLTP